MNRVIWSNFVANMEKEKYCIYLSWPRYLAQWYAHEMYRLAHTDDDVLPEYHYNCDVADVRDLEPVSTRRGSAVRSVLWECLSRQPKDYIDLPDKEATIRLVIPNMIHKPAETYNYLKPKSKDLLEKAVRYAFRFALNKYMMAMDNFSLPVKDLLAAFMENNGIELTDQNTYAVTKIWDRMRNNKLSNKSKAKNKMK